MKALRDACDEMILQPVDTFLAKVIEIYEMMIVRHGFMIVGLPFSGKSSGWKVLARSMSILHERFPEDERWVDVYPFQLNPKSITMGQLYGQFDPATHEWTDGILAEGYRNAMFNRVKLFSICERNH
jgi:dynein heavy chain